ncbi:hypothetical protein GGR65_003792 [Xanthomonas sp. 3376]|nr:hypothetical protein [Xanthomonas arboricola]
MSAWHGIAAGMGACAIDAVATAPADAIPTDAHAPVAVLATRHRHSSRRSRQRSTGSQGGAVRCDEHSTGSQLSAR